MTKVHYIDTAPETATVIHCANCETENPDTVSYYYGTAAITEHNESFPLHTRITYLRMEAA